MNCGKNTLMSIQLDLKLGWLRKLWTELSGIVSQILETSGKTLSEVQRIEKRLPSRSEMIFIPTFTIEDALGRVNPVDMLFVKSWDGNALRLASAAKQVMGK